MALYITDTWLSPLLYAVSVDRGLYIGAVVNSAHVADVETRSTYCVDLGLPYLTVSDCRRKTAELNRLSGCDKLRFDCRLNAYGPPTVTLATAGSVYCMAEWSALEDDRIVFELFYKMWFICGYVMLHKVQHRKNE